MLLVVALVVVFVVFTEGLVAKIPPVVAGGFGTAGGAGVVLFFTVELVVVFVFTVELEVVFVFTVEFVELVVFAGAAGAGGGGVGGI